MTEQTTHHPLAESLSALMDDQASELELQRLLKASESDAELKEAWSRYQLISAAMRRDLPTVASGGFSDRVSAAIAGEETYQTGSSPKTGSNWWHNTGRFAVAASVAAAVIIGVQQFDSGSAPGVVGTPAVADVEVERTELSPAVSLPAGYQAPSLSARTVCAQSGYEPRQQESRQVIFIPRQSSPQQVSAEQIRDYLNQLIEEHADHASLNSGQGMLPFARVVMTEEEQPQHVHEAQE
jgi:sigma-E factor negative regulatory protein RseA